MSEAEEMFKELNRRLDQREETIQKMKKEIEELKTKLEEKPNRQEVKYLNYYCAKCGKSLTEEEVQAETCTACGSSTYTTH